MGKSNKKSTKGALLKGVLEHVPSDSFEVLGPELKSMMKGYAGIYALYKKDKIYYVGLAKNLSGRIISHIERSRHKGKWNQFSVFMVARTKFLKDLETLVLRISKPPANKIRGKLPQHYRLTRQVASIANQLRRKADKIRKALR